MRYTVLGGAGSMGRIVVRDLLEHSQAGDEIVIADFDLEAARRLAGSLPRHAARVEPLRVDVRDAKGAQRALAGSFVIINSVQYQLNLEVMELALAVGAHYIDLGGLFHMTRRQLELDARFRTAGLLALVGMGAAPGITNLLARQGCESLEEVREIHLRVAGVDRTRYRVQPALAVSYSLQTVLEEFSLEPAVFRKGEFAFVPPMSGATAQRFPSPIGVARPMHTLHSEVATLPLSYARQGVREVTFKIAFDPDFLGKVCFLRDLGLASSTAVRVGGVEVKPIELVNRVAMAQPRPVPQGPLRQHEVVRAVVKGLDARGKKVSWVLDCQTSGFPKWGVGTDINTGSPPAVAALMLARGEISSRGVLPPEAAVTPARMFEALKERGLRVTSRRRPGWDFKV